MTCGVKNPPSAHQAAPERVDVAGAEDEAQVALAQAAREHGARRRRSAGSHSDRPAARGVGGGLGDESGPLTPGKSSARSRAG